MMQRLRMNKEELKTKILWILGGNPDESKVENYIDSALAFVNGYTFQNYSFNKWKIPDDVFTAIIDLVIMKSSQKLWVASERLSDYSISYRAEELPMSVKTILDRFINYNVH